MDKVVEAAKAQGWRVEKSRGGHWRLLSPDGEGIVYAAATPGSARSVQKTISHLRRFGFRWKGR